MRVRSKHLIGANVHTVKQPDITAIKNVRAAKVQAIYLWAWGIKQRFRRTTFERMGAMDWPSPSKLLPALGEQRFAAWRTLLLFLRQVLMSWATEPLLHLSVEPAAFVRHWVILAGRGSMIAAGSE